ncbi:MAG: hypothetical protein FWF29_11960 [Treponema sp.]|nr:hypothetical protein [Treponema sp.]
MKKGNVFFLGLLAVVMVMGLVLSGCAQLAAVAITGASQNSQDKKLHAVITHAIGEIEKVLPDNASVWINKGKDSASYNRNAIGVVTSTGGAADTAVDDITSAFIQKGIHIVDRQNEALIQAEQKFQMGGNVSDQEIMSIGKAAGANILITVSVIPQGNTQRLQIRVLDIEKGVPLMQSGSDKEWLL